MSVVQGCLLRASFYDNYLQSSTQMTASTWHLKQIKFLLQSLPPIRNQSNRKKKKKKEQPSASNKDNMSKGEARISSYDYRSWDKFDVVSFWCLMHSTFYSLESHWNLIFISLKADWSLGLPSVTTDIFLHFHHRPIWLTQCCTHYSNLRRFRLFVYCICIIMWHSHLNDMEIPETKHFIRRGFELGTTLS